MKARRGREKVLRGALFRRECDDDGMFCFELLSPPVVLRQNPQRGALRRREVLCLVMNGALQLLKERCSQ